MREGKAGEKEGWADALDGLLRERSARVGIIGLGYVGLPLAKAVGEAGFPSTGFDCDPVKIRKLLADQSYIQSIGGDAIAGMRKNGFEPTGNHDRLRGCDVVLICVPTPLTPDREPDLRFVVDSTRRIALTLRPGQLVILESTTYPTTTRNVVFPILAESGLRIGSDFFLAYSPERENPGQEGHSISQLPKVVGGIEENSLRLACEFYRHIAGAVVPVCSVEIAEASKILENTYRAVNIALINETKMLYDKMGIDIWEVIAAAKTKPFGFQPFYPGPGLGGHCIPIDPFYLAWLARQHGQTSRLIELAGEINVAMPRFILDKLAKALADEGKTLSGSRILLLGMAYKKDVDDPRESPGFELMKLLREHDAIVSYNDPHIPVLPVMRKYSFRGIRSTALTKENLRDHDAVVVVADHSLYDWPFVMRHAALIVDTRNATHGHAGPARVVKA